MEYPSLRRLSFCAAVAVAAAVCRGASPAEPATDALRSSVEALLQAPGGDEAMVASELLFKELPPERFPAAVALLERGRPGVERKFAMASAIKRWARADGPAAYAYAQVQTVLGRIEAESLALAGWAASEPEKAWREAMIVSNMAADPRYGVISVLEQVAAADLDLALRLYQDLVPDRACLQCSAAYLMVAAARSGRIDVVAEAVAAMQPGPSRDALRDGYWHYIGQFLPEWGLDRLGGVADPVDARAAEVAFCSGWALSDFDACLRHILDDPRAGRFEELILPAVGAWARQADQDDLLAFVRSLPRDLAQRSLLGLATQLASIDPKITLDWVASFPESEVRVNSLDRAIHRWARVDQRAALEYVRSAQDVETRGILLWGYLMACIANQTLEYEDLAEIDDRFVLEWRERLFKQISAQLADPAVNRSGKYDLAEYRRAVEARDDLSPAAVETILEPFKRKRP